MSLRLLSLCLMCLPCLALAFTETQWNGAGEKEEIESRIQRFYAHPNDPTAMNRRQPKFDAETNESVHPNDFLKNPDGTKPYTLSWLAGRKLSPRFQAAYEKLEARHFPKLAREEKRTWAAAEANDRVENLTSGWLTDVTYDLDAIPDSGRSELPLWSDDYWAIKYGLTSYRYAQYSRTPFKTYRAAVASYSEPGDWMSWLNLPPAWLQRQIVNLSPAEKYDLTLGDESFTLTNEQKKEGLENLGKDGDVEDWMGICHGWTAAAIMAARPVHPVTVIGARGIPVEWYPADVRAMATLAWANGDFPTNSISGRCKAKKPAVYPNGRLRDQDCFDTNPSTFHLALGNLIGRGRKSFVMDKSFDYQVWNQPIQSYELTYFNPLYPRQRSSQWRQVAVPYDWRFKAVDRFQHPLTRGVRTLHGYSDRGVKYIVGVIATVTYLAEVYPSHSPQAGHDMVERETYTYDLEMYEYNGRYYPQGGEWHENAHPDFLWVPGRNSAATEDADNVALLYNPSQPPSANVTQIARSASSSGYPLCQVVRALVNASSGKNDYPCATH